MKVLNNGVISEVKKLKHFKLGMEEYILYSKANDVYVGLINQNKILIPSADKGAVLIKVLSNMLSDNPLESINIENNCILLNDNMDIVLEEIGSQKINMPVETLNKILNINTVPVVNEVNNQNNVVYNEENNKDVFQTNTEDTGKRKRILKKLFIVLIVIGLGIGACIYKDELIGFVSNLFGSKKIEGIEIVNGQRTYAMRSNTLDSNNEVYDSIETVLRYDEKGNFKYCKLIETITYTDDIIKRLNNISDKEIKEKFKNEVCNKMKGNITNGAEFICTINGHSVTAGIIFTDEVINSRYGEAVMSNLSSSIKNITDEEYTKESYLELKDKLKSSKKEVLIIANEKQELSD